MQILKINGTEQAFPDGLPATLADLLDRLKIDRTTVVAEVDGRIVKRMDFASQPLSPGQTVELIRFVGGG